MIRRFGEPPLRTQRYIHRAGVYAVLLREGRMLVTLQRQPVRELQLPGGGIDPGETPLRALHREIMEETGWKIRDARRIGAFRRFTYMPDYDIWAEKLCTVYSAIPTQRLRAPSEPFHDAVWIDPAEAAERLGNAGDRDFTRRIVSALA